jgi:hypothetical protein
MIFRWRAQFGGWRQERSDLAEVQVVDGQRDDKPETHEVVFDLPNLLPKPDGTDVVELADGRRGLARG